MQSEKLARLLLNTTENERADILRDSHHVNFLDLAIALKNICNDVWHNDPAGTKASFSILETLSNQTNQPEIDALTILCNGLILLGENQLDTAIDKFDEARSAFLVLNKPVEAAEAQSRKVIALAILGHYEKAIECGLEALKVFETTNQIQALELLELNLGNLYLRRNHFQEAESFLIKARKHATEIGQNAHLAMICNSLALLYSSQNKFRESEELYKEALTHAHSTEQTILQADIEANLGELSLFQGKFSDALDYLEKARRRFQQLGNKQRSALAELEIADAYLELNLHPEAKERYEKLTYGFIDFGMRAEHARSAAQLGRAFLSLQEFKKAQMAFETARKLYEEENNPIGVALTKLSLAQLYFETGQDEIKELTNEAEVAFEKHGALRHLLITRWLKGETERINKNFDIAETLLTSILDEADKKTQPQIMQKCLTSLGLLKSEMGYTKEAEHYFLRAIDLIENMRSPLQGEEFRTAFFADKLVPYYSMLRICLDDTTNDRTQEAFCFLERARSRALADKIVIEFQTKPKDEFETNLYKKIAKLREDLNWFYNQLNRIQQSRSEDTETKVEKLNSSINQTETQTLELMRQLQQGRKNSVSDLQTVDITNIVTHLSDRTALVEYTYLDDEWIAFVLTNEGLQVVRSLGNEADTQTLIEQFYFQIGSLQHGANGVRQHLELLTKRSQHYLKQLYDILLEPLEEILGERRLAIVPHKSLHYVPFQALFDGNNYVIEKREVCYAPSARIFEHCLSLPRRSFQKALLMGVADERAPQVTDEIESITKLFNNSLAFLNEEATIDKLTKHASETDIIHLACHGQFRQDNPTFSTLKLGNGYLTVHDASLLKLNCELVTLSACETGINLIAPGDEIIGLARGFFAAGTPSLLLSLWSVDDEATKTLMTIFYKYIQSGSKPAEALRQSQLQLMIEKPHPFFWSPFVLNGRW